MGDVRLRASVIVLLGTGGVASAQGVIAELGGPTQPNTDINSIRLASIGDLNGDGVSETAFASSTYINNQWHAYVWVRSTGEVSSLLWETPPNPSWSQSSTGYVDGIGDVNNDGYPDLALATVGLDFTGPFHSLPRLLTTIHSGVDGAVLQTIWPTIFGTAKSSNGGGAVTRSLDANVDGFLDVVVNESAGIGFFGQMRAISVATGQVLWSHAGIASASLGVEFEMGDDADGDSIPDIFTDEWSTSSRSISVRSGATGYVIATQSTSTSYPGTSAGDAFAPAGDHDGDGIRDMFSDWNATADGHEVAILSGVDASYLHSFGSGGIFQSGAQADLHRDRFASIPDMTGDGFVDLVIGNPQFVISQSPYKSGIVAVLNGRNGQVQFAVTAKGSDEWNFGRSLCGSTDLNFDGRGDFVVAPALGSSSPYTGKSTAFSTHCGSSTPSGTGCPGGGGSTPSLSFTGCIASGCAPTLSIHGFTGGFGPMIYVLGSQTASIPIKAGCSLLVAPPHIIGVGGSGVSAPGQGSMSFPYELPLAALAGNHIVVQLFFADPFVPHGFSASNALTVNF